MIPGDRMFVYLPAVFRRRDDSGDLGRLLSAFEALFFAGEDTALPGFEQRLNDIPALFAPAGEDGERTPDRFLPWLADWLAFTPHRLFAPDALRRILAGIVPLYGRRGTRAYLGELIALACGDEVVAVAIDDYLHDGFRIGRSRLGVDTWLVATRPLRFKVVVDVTGGLDAEAAAARDRRLAALIDFARPAHTTWELEIRHIAGAGQRGR